MTPDAYKMSRHAKATSAAGMEKAEKSVTCKKCSEVNT